MNKLYFTIFLLTASTFTFAQTITFGIKAAFNLSEETQSVPFFTSSLLPGFNAGGIVDIGFQHFSIQPGLFFSSKGENVRANFQGFYPGPASSLDGTGKVILNYIELPVN